LLEELWNSVVPSLSTVYQIGFLEKKSGQWPVAGQYNNDFFEYTNTKISRYFLLGGCWLFLWFFLLLPAHDLVVIVDCYRRQRGRSISRCGAPLAGCAQGAKLNPKIADVNGTNANAVAFAFDVC